ncbi:glycosyltransferase [Candidatus Dependentiae bacterium]|nr:glycosyltransferase [Candidatus Dependentiae bacterium]
MEKNLPYIYKALSENKNYEIIIVDDCSKDDSVNFLEQTYPEIKIIRHIKNKGFSAACNSGIFSAVNEILCIVNSDVAFDKDFFKYAMPHFEIEKTGAVAGLIKNYTDNFNNIDHYNTYIIPYFKRGFFRYKNAEYDESDKTSKKVLANLGCCFLGRKTVLLNLKGYNEIYSPYIWEDTDLGYRLNKSGFDTIFEPKAVVYHQTSSTLKKQNQNKLKIISTRNKFLFFWLNIRKFSKWNLHIFFIILSLSTRWIIFDWVYYLSLIQALKKICARQSV